MSGKSYFEKESSTILDKIKDTVKCIFNGIKSIWSSVWEFIKGVYLFILFLFLVPIIYVLSMDVSEKQVFEVEAQNEYVQRKDSILLNIDQKENYQLMILEEISYQLHLAAKEINLLLIENNSQEEKED